MFKLMDSPRVSDSRQIRMHLKNIRWFVAHRDNEEVIEYLNDKYPYTLTSFGVYGGPNNYHLQNNPIHYEARSVDMMKVFIEKIGVNVSDPRW